MSSHHVTSGGFPPAIRRVAMVVVHANPLAEPGEADAGGMSVYVREVARALAGGGVEVDVYTRLDRSGVAEESPFPGVQVIPIRAGEPELPKEKLPQYLPEFVSNVAAAAEERFAYDILHSHYWLSGRVASMLKDRWAIPFVHTFHTLGLVKNNSLAPGEIAEPAGRLWGEAKVIDQACAIVASSYQERRCLVDLYAAHPERVHVVPPGVDHRLFTPAARGAARRALNISEDKVLLFVGRLQPLKGAGTAIAAAACLAREHSGLRLLIVGGPSGPAGAEEPARLKDLARRLGISQAVDFLGPLPQRRLPEIYTASDVCVVPSLTESFGLVALEAQACGVPVVASATGGLKSIVADGKTGFLVQPGSAELFADRIDKILYQPGLAGKMGLAATARSAAFSWERSADALRSVYADSTIRQECFPLTSAAP